LLRNTKPENSHAFYHYDFLLFFLPKRRQDCLEERKGRCSMFIPLSSLALPLGCITEKREGRW
jgi:hypothetical protein